MFNSPQSLLCDLGIVICSPDLCKRASTRSSQRERVWGSTFANSLLKPGAMKKALEAKLPLIDYLIGTCRCSIIGNALETDNRSAVVRNERTELLGMACASSKPQWEGLGCLYPGVKRWKRWDIQEAGLQRPMLEELSLFSTGKVLGTLHNQYLAWTMEVLARQQRKGVQRMWSQAPWAQPPCCPIRSSSELVVWLVGALRGKPAFRENGSLWIRVLPPQRWQHLWYWHMKSGLNHTKDLRSPCWRAALAGIYH